MCFFCCKQKTAYEMRISDWISDVCSSYLINTENFHLHIAINKIHPVTLKVHMPFRDFKVLEKVSREMEKKYALKLDLGRADKIEPEKQAARARDKEAHTWEQSFDKIGRAHV